MGVTTLTIPGKPALIISYQLIAASTLQYILTVNGVFYPRVIRHRTLIRYLKRMRNNVAFYRSRLIGCVAFDSKCFSELSTLRKSRHPLLTGRRYS